MYKSSTQTGHTWSSVSRRRAVLALSLFVTLSIGYVGSVVSASAASDHADLHSASAQVDTYVQQAKLTAKDGAAGDYFGSRVALSTDGSTALIGAVGDGSGDHQGTAYVFTASGGAWTQQAELRANDGQPSDDFGFSDALSADGNTALIGASGTGAAYMFTRHNDSWSQQAELTASDGAVNDSFGWAVALSADGTTALVGVDSPKHQGAAYVFTISNGSWSQQAELTTKDGQAQDYFGSSVALSRDGGTALIGAVKHATDPASVGEGQGAAYIFTASAGAWTQQAELRAEDGGTGDNFGGSVGLSGDGKIALVGAIGVSVGNGNGQGAAYEFTATGSSWVQKAELTARNGVAYDNLGIAVGLSGDGSTALAGAWFRTVGRNNAQGAAYIFSAPTWTQQAALVAHDGAANDQFGAAVALSSDGRTALVGSPSKKVGDNDLQGAAYIFVGSTPTRS